MEERKASAKMMQNFKMEVMNYSSYFVGFDPLKIPPDIKLAVKHGRASTVGRIQSFNTFKKNTHQTQEAHLCPCCGRTTVSL